MHTRGSMWTKEERDRIDDMLKNGHSDAEIAKVMGRSPSLIHKLRQSTKRIDRWSQQEVEQLDELLEQGLSDSEIAERLGKTKQAVNGKRRSLGIVRLSEDGKWFGGVFRRRGHAITTRKSASPQKIRSWTPEEVKKLQEMVSQGLGNPEIAQILGRTLSSVSGFRRRKLEPPGNENLERLFHGTRPAAWSSEEIEVLRSLTERGFGDIEIARKLGRNRVGVATAKQKHLIRTAEGVELKEKTKFRPRYWSEVDMSSLKELVLQGMADPDIAVKLNRSESSVALQRRKLGLRRRPPIWHEKSAEGDPKPIVIKPVLRAQLTGRDAKEESSSNINASSEIACAKEAPGAECMTMAESNRKGQDSPTACVAEGNFQHCKKPSLQTAPDDADRPPPWTESDLARLENLCNSNLSSQKIASELGRTLRDVLAAREKHGFEVKPGTAKPRLKWSSARLSEIKSLLASGMPESEVASHLELSIAALRQLRKRKGILYVEGEKRLTRMWQPVEIEQVKKLKSEGKTVKEIAELMFRNRKAIWTILARIRMEEGKRGKSADKTSSSSRPYRAWTEKDITTLRDLYVSEELSPDVIAEKLGRSEVSIKSFLAKHREKLMREDFTQLLSEIVRTGLWTEKEIDRMCELTGEGRGWKEIAKEMKRSEIAVKLRRWIILDGVGGER
ncbi:RNA polymerase sigma factor SigL [Teratosphaeria destructans]|uniref:RNA polymerase sigma factor SigL n=1 Tax=Teratosphaeria destructans TaxID=418781 RepID=A0A9W7SV98_9PEZI|nr:RNA polymerase sigma factor SigL [Teratosphaeria destructans]